MLDSLEIIGLSVETHIGVHAWEQAIKQKLLIDVYIPIDCSNYADDITIAIDYQKLCQQIIDFVTNKAFKLIETVANEVADLIKNSFDVKSVKVIVSKPFAIPQAQNVRVVVNRG